MKLWNHKPQDGIYFLFKTQKQLPLHWWKIVIALRSQFRTYQNSIFYIFRAFTNCVTLLLFPLFSIISTLVIYGSYLLPTRLTTNHENYRPEPTSRRVASTVTLSLSSNCNFILLEIYIVVIMNLWLHNISWTLSPFFIIFVYLISFIVVRFWLIWMFKVNIHKP